MRSLKALAFTVAAGLLAAGLGTGFARASLAALDAAERIDLPPSAAPGLLGPIDPLGRGGWLCLPERAAATARASRAELPDENDR